MVDINIQNGLFYYFHCLQNERKIAKYEEMLKKCTEEIRRNRAKITEMQQEAENLKAHANSATDEVCGDGGLAR